MTDEKITKMKEEDERIYRKLKSLELPEYRHIPWMKDFSCPDCGKNEWSSMDGWKARPIGWCNTEEGYMCIFECPACFAKMRWHISTTGRWSEEMFLGDLWCVMMTGNRELLDEG